MKKIIALFLIAFGLSSATAYACTEGGASSDKCQKICDQFSHFDDNSYGACMVGATKK